MKNITSQKVSGRFQYVVTEAGELRVGRGGHIDLSGGSSVRAAGEVKFVNGRVRSINNKSGHYKPSGASQKQNALDAFGADESLYVEKAW